jgi:hypothetical protein
MKTILLFPESYADRRIWPLFSLFVSHIFVALTANILPSTPRSFKWCLFLTSSHQQAGILPIFPTCPAHLIFLVMMTLLATWIKERRLRTPHHAIFSGLLLLLHSQYITFLLNKSSPCRAVNTPRQGFRNQSFKLYGERIAVYSEVRTKSVNKAEL